MGTAGVKLEYEQFEEVTRGEWGALPPIARQYIILPANVVVLHFTNTNTCSTRQDCVRILRKLQRKHMGDYNLIDIKYNFIIGGDGAVYEGRGWHAAGVRVPLRHQQFMSGAHFESIDVAFIGTPEDLRNSEIMRKTSDAFVKAAKLNLKLRMETMYLWTEGGDAAYKEARKEAHKMKRENWWYWFL